MNRRNALFSVLSVGRGLVWRVSGLRTVGVRGIVRDDNGHVLLVKHSYGGMGWHLPGGGVKRRETLAAAVARELLEEAGAVIEPASLELFGAYSNMTEGKSDHIVVFLAHSWKRVVDTRDREIVAAEFFPPACPPDGTTPGTRRRLDELLSGTTSFAW